VIDNDLTHEQVWHDLGIPYPQWALTLAVAQGWNPDTHFAAIFTQDEDEIGSTHPYLWLPEIQGQDYDAAEADGNAIAEGWNK
jgi:hypothetical protein